MNFLVNESPPKPFGNFGGAYVTLCRGYWTIFCVKSGYMRHGSHRLEKYLNLECFLEKSLKIKSALKSTGKSLKDLEKCLNSSVFCRT